MRNYIKRLRPILSVSVMLVVLLTASCEDYVEIGSPETQVGAEKAFNTDESATSSVLGIYGSFSNLVGYYGPVMGLSGDQLASSESDYDPFYSGNVKPVGFRLEYNLWIPSYETIMQANLAISQLEEATALTPAVKEQLLGEAKFIRAFVYFNLVSMFGDVPLPLTENIIDNATLPRTAAAEVWDQILLDVTEAKELLSEEYVSASFRTRINKATADAFLARLYLYQEDWANAETEATRVISDENYTLADLESKFINSSNETIWQFYDLYGISTYGESYGADDDFLPLFYLSDDFATSFEDADLRKEAWTKSITVNGLDYTTINKYKLYSGSGDEYDVVFRLAEQYLIRAEARAQQDNLAGALSDINAVRAQAGLEVLSGLSKAETLRAVERERQFELFGEWGHRWLDLKRTPSLTDPSESRAHDVLSQIKPDWQPTDLLYPLPFEQFKYNENLTQNPGY